MAKRNNVINLSKLILWIIISDLIIFWPFLSGKLLYVFQGWGYDTFHSYVPVMKFFSSLLLEGRTDLMSLQFGLGGDVFAFQIWLTNPIACIIYLMVFVLQNDTIVSALVILFPILTSVVGGVFCYLYLMRYICSDISLIIAAYMYSLCGYLVSTGTHYFFATNLIFYPLLLIAIDYLLYENRAIPFVWAVFFVAIQGPYTAFPMFVMAALYILYKVIFVLQKGGLKTLYILLRNGVLGLILAAFILIPSSFQILGTSGRVSGGQSLLETYFNVYPFFIDKDTCITAILRLFSNNLQGNVEEWTGVYAWFEDFPYFFSVLFVFLVPQYVFVLLNKDNLKKKLASIVCFAGVVFLLCTNVFSGFLNLFSYNHWRMIFIFLPFFAYVSGVVLQSIVNEHRFSTIINLLCLVSFVGLLVFLYVNNYITDSYAYKTTIIFVVLFAVIVELLYIVYKTKKMKIQMLMSIMLVGTLSMNYIVDHRYSVVDGAMPLQYNNDNAYYQDDELLECIDTLAKDSFVRIEKTFMGKGPDADWSLTMPCRTVSTYDSTLGQGVKDYITYMVNFGCKEYNYTQLIYAPNSMGDYGVEFDATRAALLGVKYVITNQKRDLEDWEQSRAENGYYMYENTTIESACVLYDNYMTEQQYESLSMVEKIAVEPQCLIVNEDVGMQRNLAELTYKKENISKDDVRVGENYQINIGEKIEINAGERKALLISIMSNQLSNVSIGRSIDGVNIIYEDYFVEGETDLCQLLEDDCKYIYIVNNGTDNISFTTELIYVPIKYKGDIILTNENMRDEIYGCFSLDEKSLMYIPIPYASGWKAYIDGEEAEIFKANYGFMGIEIPKGNHELKLKYTNNLFEISVVISLIGLLVVVIYMSRKIKK